MKMKLTLLVAAAALAASVTVSQAALTMGFAGLNNAQFNSQSGVNSFQLNPAAASSSANAQFRFTDAFDSTWLGWVTAGPWTVNMATLTINGPIQQAQVIGGGQLNIWDGTGGSSNAGNTLTGNVSWLTIQTIGAFGGSVADSLSINISGLAYTGANATLQQFAAGKVGNINLTFQFSGSAPTLQQLFPSTGTNISTASFSGSISSVPEPSTVVAGALLLLPFGVSTLRILRKTKE